MSLMVILVLDFVAQANSAKSEEQGNYRPTYHRDALDHRLFVQEIKFAGDNAPR